MSISVSTLFSSLGSSQSKSSTFSADSNFGISLSDYATIKSGAYYKLMKNYYETKTSSDSSSSTSTAKDTSSLLARIEDTSDSLKDAADALLTKGNKSVFNKVEKTDENGNKTYDYDTDAIYKKVDEFVKSYNSMLTQAGEAESTNILSTTSSLVKYTKANEDMLGSIGVTIGTDNKLTLDETSFKKADMGTVKSMFNTTGSYGYQTSAKASMIYYYAEQAASKSNTYGSSGMYTYNYATGEIYNTTT